MPANIEQPELRDPLPNERIVRTGGLYYILPNAWAVGDVLTEELAAFLNAAWHSAIINRFKDLRQSLESNDSTTYHDLDKALQEFAAEFSVTPRATKPLEEPKPEQDEEEKEAFAALVKFARPDFNKAMREVKGLPRKKYEELLREYVRENRAQLEEDLAAHQAAMERTIANLRANLPQDT